MIADGMALLDLFLDEMRHLLGVLADEEEGRLHAFALEGLEDLRRRLGRPVVEGQHDLAVAELERARVALQPDGQPFGAVDFDVSRRPELVGATVGRRARHRQHGEKRRENEKVMGLYHGRIPRCIYRPAGYATKRLRSRICPWTSIKPK